MLLQNFTVFKIITYIFLRKKENFIRENLRIQTILTKMFLKLYSVLVNILHKKFYFMRASKVSEKIYVPVSLNMDDVS